MTSFLFPSSFKSPGASTGQHWVQWREDMGMQGSPQVAFHFISVESLVTTLWSETSRHDPTWDMPQNGLFSLHSMSHGSDTLTTTHWHSLPTQMCLFCASEWDRRTQAEKERNNYVLPPIQSLKEPILKAKEFSTTFQQDVDNVSDIIQPDLEQPERRPERETLPCKDPVVPLGQLFLAESASKAEILSSDPCFATHWARTSLNSVSSL